MIALPCDIPVVKDLNSYYLHIEKFLEHYQGFMAAGAVHFASPSASGIIFFDEYRFLNAEYTDKTESINGPQAFRKLIQTASQKNFSVSVFEIDMDSIYYWAHTSNASEAYRELAAESIDIATLIEKMKSEKLTGYIQIDFTGGKDRGCIFMNNGAVTASQKKAAVLPSQKSSATEEVIKKTAEKGGLFRIFSIQLNRKLEEIAFTPSASRQTVGGDAQKNRVEVKTQPSSSALNNNNEAKAESMDYLIEMLQLLLQMLEKIIKSNKKIKIDFETMLKKIFVEKVDKYDFLDPFAAELIYENGRLRFYGTAKEKELVHGVVECAMELAERAGVYGLLEKSLAPWIKKYGNDLNRFNIKF